MVPFYCKQLIFCDGHEEDLIAIYLCEHSIITCKVGCLPAHLNCHMGEYDGLIVHMIAVYTNHCANVAKHQKF